MPQRLVISMIVLLFVSDIGLGAQRKAAGKEHSWKGWITDTKCGAKGANPAHADCAKKCIAAGEKYALYDTATKKLYVLEPQDKLAEHAGHFVKLTGALEGDTIHIASVSQSACTGGPYCPERHCHGRCGVHPCTCPRS